MKNFAPLLCFVVACSSATTASPTSTPPTGTVMPEDGGAVPDSGSTSSGGPTDAAVDAAVSGPINGCADADYVDKTAAADDRKITWIRSVGKTCWKIKKGQTVTWDPQQMFSAHPLNPKNGSANNPIAKQSAASTDPYAVPFSESGTYGFICGFHFDMTGAIQVVE